MGLKMFDLPPGGLADGAVAEVDKEQSTSAEVKPQIITEQVSPDDPVKKKVKMPDGATYPEGSEEYDRIVEEYKLEKPSIKAAMRTKLAVHMMKVEIPEQVIDELNDHIDKVNIPANDDYSDGLVGQINRDKKSAQLNFPLLDGVGAEFKKIIDECSRSYMKQGYGQDVTADAFEAWTVHSYAGDYNPLHDHGCRTEAGLSMILYLKVPECIQKLPDPSELGGGVNINHASGVVDGYTYFTWGNHNMRDVVSLKPVTEEYVKPEAGTLILFPNWLRHSVNPFFGEGERRTFSANVNLFDNNNFKIKGNVFGKMTAEEQLKVISQYRGRKKINKVTGEEVTE
mgnify:CR=1 FL=1